MSNIIHQIPLNINYSIAGDMQVVVASNLHKRACRWMVANLNPKTKSIMMPLSQALKGKQDSTLLCWAVLLNANIRRITQC